MRLSPETIKIIKLIKTGQFIVPGGGITIKQLPTGQYELSMSTSDLASNQSRTPAPPDTSGDPSVPSTPNKPPAVPQAPPIPTTPDDASGTYGGPTKRGRKIKGAGADGSDSAPYDFNQRGWQYYVDNF